MIVKKIADEIKKVLKNLQQNNSEIVTKEYLRKDMYLRKEYKIIDEMRFINFLDNTPSQPTKFRTKNWIEINDDACGTYKKDSQIKFKT